MQVVKDFSGGIYLRYRLAGPVTLRVAQLCGGRGDAMINAIFFDPE
jgi:hypothetical protein